MNHNIHARDNAKHKKNSMYRQKTTGIKLFLAPKICLKYRSPKKKKIISQPKLHQIYKAEVVLQAICSNWTQRSHCRI